MIMAASIAVEPEEDLQALFDRIANEREAAEDTATALDQVEQSCGAALATVADDSEADGPHAELPSPLIFDRIGKLTRSLHEALRELGYDKAVGQAVGALPDARDRLAYIATLTGQAAERTLGALDEIKPIQEALEGEATGLANKWDRLLAGAMPNRDFKTLVLSTQQFLRAVPQHTGRTNSHLLEIMMAQDFHDLTGQVIKKVVDLAQDLEHRLLQLLIDTSPKEQPAQQFDGHLNGPVVQAKGRDDVVTSQAQVDDLLESLGF
jgi:chemotaxis protein CheZ